MRFLILFFTIIIVFSCKYRNAENCFPGKPAGKIVILVADTAIFSRNFIPGKDTNRTHPVFHGIGFVDSNGMPLHKPLQKVTLTESQRQAFLKILRPLAPQTDGEMLDCIPYYRHAVLFYDHDDRLIAQMQICFDCEIVAFAPDADCMSFFANQRMPELKHFFKANNIFILPPE